jgi:hypothetical protein
MNNERRQLYLKIGAAIAVGTLLLDYVVIEPSLKGWKAQSDRIAALSGKVNRGSQLRERESTLKNRWADMLRVNLPTEVSAAESAAFKAVSRWVSESRISVTSLTQQWQTRDDGFDTFECRLAATGSQEALGHFLYELETDSSVPVNLEECELTTRDARGSQLTLTARITFLRLKDSSKNSAP